MKCPNCNNSLKQQNIDDITLDVCVNCQGKWFEYEELDELEDTVLADDEVKGQRVWHEEQSDRTCPTCHKTMKKFNYMLNDLTLEYCPEKHGFFLDDGEAKKVKELMKEDIKDLKRKYEVEQDWEQHVQNLRKNILMQKTEQALSALGL